MRFVTGCTTGVVYMRVDPVIHTESRMLLDIYRSGVNQACFLAIPAGRPLASATIPAGPDYADLALHLQGADLLSGVELKGLDADQVLKQVADVGYAVFKADAP
jgi:hypothetical protein